MPTFIPVIPGASFQIPNECVSCSSITNKTRKYGASIRTGREGNYKRYLNMSLELPFCESCRRATYRYLIEYLSSIAFGVVIGFIIMSAIPSGSVKLPQWIFFAIGIPVGILIGQLVINRFDTLPKQADEAAKLAFDRKQNAFVLRIKNDLWATQFQGGAPRWKSGDFNGNDNFQFPDKCATCSTKTTDTRNYSSKIKVSSDDYYKMNLDVPMCRECKRARRFYQISQWYFLMLGLGMGAFIVYKIDRAVEFDDRAVVFQSGDFVVTLAGLFAIIFLIILIVVYLTLRLFTNTIFPRAKKAHSAVRLDYDNDVGKFHLKIGNKEWSKEVKTSDGKIIPGEIMISRVS